MPQGHEMKRTFQAAMLFLLRGSLAAPTQSQVSSTPASETYSQAEIEAYNAVDAEKDPDRRIVLVEEFASKYPNSSLLVYVYPQCYTGYGQSKNYSKILECADGLLKLGDRAAVSAQYSALHMAAIAYNNLNSDDPLLAQDARKRALRGVMLLPRLKRPDLLNESAVEARKHELAFEVEMKREENYLQATAGRAALVMKDYFAASVAFKTIIARNAVGALPEPAQVAAPVR
jgi:hypothetical protein